MKTFKTLKTLTMQLALAVAACAPMQPVQAHGDAPAGDFNLHKLLAQARKATLPFNDLQAALAAGYVKFPDQHGDCVDQPGPVSYTHLTLPTNREV